MAFAGHKDMFNGPRPTHYHISWMADGKLGAASAVRECDHSGILAKFWQRLLYKSEDSINRRAKPLYLEDTSERCKAKGEKDIIMETLGWLVVLVTIAMATAGDSMTYNGRYPGKFTRY